MEWNGLYKISYKPVTGSRDNPCRRLEDHICGMVELPRSCVGTAWYHDTDINIFYITWYMLSNEKSCLWESLSVGSLSPVCSAPHCCFNVFPTMTTIVWRHLLYYTRKYLVSDIQTLRTFHIFSWFFITLILFFYFSYFLFFYINIS